MRVTVDHQAGRSGYQVDCTILFSEEEKAIIVARGLQQHHLALPRGYVAVLDPTEQRRVYALRLAVAAGVSVFGLFWAGATGGHPSGAFLFFGGAAYAVYCLYRWLVPRTQVVERVQLADLLKHKSFSVAVPNSVRGQEMAAELLASILVSDQPCQRASRRAHRDRLYRRRGRPVCELRICQSNDWADSMSDRIVVQQYPGQPCRIGSRSKAPE